MSRLNTRVGMTVSTEPGRFKTEQYRSEFDGRYRVQWQYCDWGGLLHTGSALTRDEAVRQAERYGYRPYRGQGRHS